MKIRKIYFTFSLCVLLLIFIFIFLGKYKFIGIRLSSGKLIGLWSTSQLFLNKDMDVISKKFGIDFQEKQKGFKIDNVDKDQTNIKFSNSGIYYKCLNEADYELINIYIDENVINNRRLSSNLYYIVLKCISLNAGDDNQTNINIEKTDFINYLMRISSNKNILKSIFIPLNR